MIQWDMRKKDATLARRLDQFYTNRNVAAQCAQFALSILNEHGVDTSSVRFIEPSAGGGAFLDALPSERTVAMDIAPMAEGVMTQDFLTWEPEPRSGSEPVVAIGNPPFGKNASLALAFVNRSAELADWVAMILPRTFEKESMARRVHPNLHLVASMPLDANSYTLDGAPCSVPTVFQVYRRIDVPREKQAPRPMAHPDFIFVKNPLEADFAFQRVGVAAGRASVEGLRKAAPSHHFIKIAEDCPRDVLNIFQSIDWSDVKHRTAGNPSISKAEMIEAYTLATMQTLENAQ